CARHLPVGLVAIAAGNRFDVW
nr:immunoglobulin heavy chain junction region [Macaca mulatta]MOY21928.1 immunoglobulin heavy chain junction region [Macaca mulatta]MOY23773.1 immunoglobulin heavy chain junction region [Macaca mulatta]MOY24168.1 immunoglobulin heavy chain junction region [Macaca mulatta]MOY25905.1 immunoglobulin heavy chain junction region [Macaca mulatta]